MATASWLEKPVSKARKAQQIANTHTHTHTHTHKYTLAPHVDINMQRGFGCCHVATLVHLAYA